MWIQSNAGVIVAQLLSHHPFVGMIPGFFGKAHSPSSCKSATPESVEIHGQALAEMLAAWETNARDLQMDAAGVVFPGVAMGRSGNCHRRVGPAVFCRTWSEEGRTIVPAAVAQLLG